MSSPVPLAGSPGPLVERHDVALLDLDGVVYLGEQAAPHAREALSRAAAGGMRLAYVTNNARRTPGEIAAHLCALGVPAQAEDVVTSAQAAGRVLEQRLPAGARVLVAGAEGLRVAVRERGLEPVLTADADPAAVVQGFDPEIAYGVLAEACLAIRAGALWVAANADATMPTPRGLLPGNGALVALLATATGQQPLVAGKPEPALHAESVERTGAQRPLVVGDRLDTDIAGAVRADTASLLVLTGVADGIDLVRAVPEQRPTYVSPDLRGLLAAHPGVERAHGLVRCGAYVADLRAGALTLEPTAAPATSGDGLDGLDGLRALAGACWDLADSGASGPEPDQLRVLLDAITAAGGSGR